MSKISLNPVRYYDVTDIYTASVDNRPLKDISTNIDLLNDAIQSLGFYQELYASLDVEPPGGFTPYTCVAVTKANTLIPIDISLSSTTINYASLPLYLIIEPLGNSLYKCISFSSSLTLASNNNMFLAESIGKALKVGPFGTLVDEIFFDLYYGNLNYQQLIVGKILTQSSFSFGGNQVNTLGDNRFISKNRNDSTTGLVTRLIDVQDSNIAFASSIMPDTLSGSGNTSPHSLYINSVSGSSLQSPPSKSPVYFSYLQLPVNNTTGDISGNIENLLNEVHFSTIKMTPTITGSTSLTAGINQSALLDFTSSYTLHGPDFSTALNETNQNISTSLSLTQSSASINFTSPSSVSILSGLDPTLLVDSSVLAYASTPVSGVSFGNFKSDSLTPSLGGGWLGFVTYGVTPHSSDLALPLIPKGPSNLDGANAVVLYAKKSSGNTNPGSAVLHLVSDGYVTLGAPNGVFYSNVPKLDYEITNKVYVDSSIKTLSDAALLKVPLAGTTTDAPITGTLVFDTTSSTAPNVVLSFNTLTSSEIHSNTHVEFKDASSALQIVCGRTPVDSSAPDFSADAFTTWQYVENKVNSVTAGSLTSYVDKTTHQTITSIKTFAEKNTGSKDGGIIIGPTSSLQIQTPDLVDPLHRILTVPNDTTYFEIKTLDQTPVKIISSATLPADPDGTLVTKGYLSSVAANQINASFDESAVYGIWVNHPVSLTTTAFAGFSGWRCLTQGSMPEMSDNFIVNFTGVGTSDGIVYTGTGTSPKSGLFLVTSTDSRNSDRGPDLGGGIYRAQSTILVKRANGTIVQYAYNIHQDDTYGSSVNSLVATSCSSTVVLHPGDTLGVLSEWCQAGSVSVTLLRYL
jgi:hypothetical protein